MKQVQEKIEQTRRAPTPPYLLVISIVLSVFIIETGIMVLIPFLPPLPDLIVAFIDSTLLLSVGGVLFYFFWFRRIKQTLSTTKQAFLEEEEKLRVIANSAQDAIIMMEEDGNISYWNPAAEKVFGYTRKEIIGKPLSEYIIPEEFRMAHKRGVERFRDKGEGSAIGKTMELKGLRKNGDVFLLELSLSSMLRGGKWHAIGLIRDITERKKIEEDHHRLVTAVEQADETIMITDKNGIILYVNPAFERITGYMRGEVIGQNPRFLKSGHHDEAFYEELWDTISHGEIWKGRFINKRKDNTLYEEEATISPMKDESENVVNYVAVKRDITKEVSLEKQLHQHQKMEAIGRLAGGIAHDFNNILTGILGYAELARRKTEDSDPRYKNMEAIIAGGNRAKGLVEQILTFSRKTVDTKVNLKLAPIIREVILLLERIIPKNIKIVDMIEETDGIVFANPNKIHQIMINLCTNAAEAMQEKGIMKISLTSYLVDESFCDVHIGCKTGEYLKISVEDTGPGISADVLDTIFEPFLTTKGTKNTGLGLAVVHGIVKELEGWVMVEKTSAKGTTFTVLLPRVYEEESVAEVEEEGVEMPGKGEQVLLVDDEEMVVDVQSQILRRLGYKVTAFTSSLEALEKFQQEPNIFDIVITDQAMPELTGERMSREIFKVRSDIPIILCTGFSNQVSEESAKAIGIRGYLTKPIIISKLSRLIREVLKAPA